MSVALRHHRWLRASAASLLLAFAPLALAPGAAAAAESDTTYGRIDGDVSLVVGAGVVLTDSAPRLGVELRLRYLETVGLFATYDEGAAFDRDAQPSRLLATGLELRPLFLARWLSGWEFGAPRADLFIDSLGLELAAFFAQDPVGPFGRRQGLETALGLEFPLFPSASGVWLGAHAGFRWSESALGASAPDLPGSRTAFLALTVAFHQTVATHLVDLRDRAQR